MSSIESLKIEPLRLGGMPIAEHFMTKLGVAESFAEFVPTDPRDKIEVAKTLSIALLNCIVERFPLY